MEIARRFLRPEVIRTLARLDLKARMIVEGFFSGLHRSPYRGLSVEFSDYRDYVPGDDPSLIDWKLYARTDKYYVKCFQAETNLRCMMLLDTSASMHYGSGIEGAPSKMEYAVALSAALSYLMIRQQDRVGLMTIDTRVRAHIPPKSKKIHLLAILEELLKTRPRERTDLAAAIESAASLIRRKGIVVLFSDLLDEPAPVVRQLRHLKHRGQDVIVFHVLDPAELRFPFRGAYLFEDPETGVRVRADPEAVRGAYFDRLHSLIRAYRRALRAHGIDYLLMDTSTPFHRALIRFLTHRRRRY